ncbi:hypothetical protein BWQ96_06358 [Gracilariopsis chorda]|uniref:DUF3253 domain-containing protein n=1 Tax=Gracilariopsis chorda TaxID=448386 RepID=A0A2V3IP92_9FLOR|nr:hypothetical protein BWQ96_06358 [Gracilariopsis chorda]|eukprot:PXF43892.1 hypothetical protein BWQ96_06358 [Gracilariopsis chorda]
MGESIVDRVKIGFLIENQLHSMLQSRGPQKSICPSDVVRSLDAQLSNGWREEMETIRSIAYRLAKEGKLSILQRGFVIPIDELYSLRGPIRLRLLNDTKRI